jgi:hypothetical protein
MTRTDHGEVGAGVENGCSEWPTSSLFLNAGAPASTNAAPAELPLRNYLEARRQLTCEAMFFPVGYPVRVLSNSKEVLAAAAQSWGSFRPVFHREPLEVLLAVKPNSLKNHRLPPAPAYMVNGALLVEVADHDNYFISDLKKGRTLAKVTEATLRSPEYLRYFFLEAATLSMIAALRAAAIHAACVSVGGKGILLCGDSGDGKSTLAFGGSRSGWTFVTDDATYLPMDREDRLIVGNCSKIRFRPSGAELFPELAGRPITPRAAGKPSIEISMADWPEISTSCTTTVDYLVFLNRKHIEKQELVPLRPSTVWPWFTQCFLRSTHESYLAQEAALSRLLSAGIFELRYQVLSWAVDRINQLAMKGN